MLVSKYAKQNGQAASFQHLSQPQLAYYKFPEPKLWSAGRASLSQCVQVKLWNSLRMRAIPEHLRGVITTRRYRNTRLPLPFRYCGTAFQLLYRAWRWHCTLPCDKSRPICSTSDVLTNIRNIHHRPALLWRFLCWHRIQNCGLTYLFCVYITGDVRCPLVKWFCPCCTTWSKSRQTSTLDHWRKIFSRHWKKMKKYRPRWVVCLWR